MFVFRIILNRMDSGIGESDFEILIAIFAGAMMDRTVGVISCRDETAISILRSLSPTLPSMLFSIILNISVSFRNSRVVPTNQLLMLLLRRNLLRLFTMS